MDVAVQGVVHDIGARPGKPAVKGGVGRVEHGVPLAMPFEFQGRLFPVGQRVRLGRSLHLGQFGRLDVGLDDRGRGRPKHPLLHEQVVHCSGRFHARPPLQSQDLLEFADTAAADGQFDAGLAGRAQHEIAARQRGDLRHQIQIDEILAVHPEKTMGPQTVFEIFEAVRGQKLLGGRMHEGIILVGLDEQNLGVGQ